MFLHLFGIDGLSLRIDAGSNHVGALIHVREQDGGADARLCMETGAAVAVPARADLKVERAVNPVLLCTKNGRQMLRHRKIQQQKVILIRLLVGFDKFFQIRVSERGRRTDEKEKGNIYN